MNFSRNCLNLIKKKAFKIEKHLIFKQRSGVSYICEQELLNQGNKKISKVMFVWYMNPAV